jgi:hypothetical protein
MKPEDIELDRKVKIVSPHITHSESRGMVLSVIEKHYDMGVTFKLSDGDYYRTWEFEPYDDKDAQIGEIIKSNWSKEQMIAYDSFLWSEEIRHQEDIVAIQKKRHSLHMKGFVSDKPGPWITEEEIARM